MLCQRMCYNYTYFIARQTELPKNYLNQHARDIILWWCQVSHLMALLNTGEVFANKTVCDVSWNGSTLSFGNHLTAISLHVPAHTSTTPIHYTMPCCTHTSLVHVLGLLFSHDYTHLCYTLTHTQSMLVHILCSTFHTKFRATLVYHMTTHTSATPNSVCKYTIIYPLPRACRSIQLSPWGL